MDLPDGSGMAPDLHRRQLPPGDQALVVSGTCIHVAQPPASSNASRGT